MTFEVRGVMYDDDVWFCGYQCAAEHWRSEVTRMRGWLRRILVRSRPDGIAVVFAKRALRGAQLEDYAPGD